MTIQRILVPVDYSPCSRAALKFAVELSRRLQASLDVVHAWDRPTYMTDAVMNSQQPLHGKTLLVMIQETAERDMREFLESSGLPADALPQGRLLAGEPATAILNELKAGGYDLLVVGTHGRTGLPRLLMGSVAEKVARLSPVPTVTVPDESAESHRR